MGQDRRLTRRGFVGAAAGAAAAWYAAPAGGAVPSRIGSNPFMFVSPRITPWVDALPLLDRRAAGGELVAATARHRFHRDLPLSPTMGFGGQSYLGPVLEAHRDQAVTQTFRNEIGRHPLADHLDPTVHGASVLDRTRPRLTVHLHGGLTEPGSDGHALATTRSGGTRVHHYGNAQEAAGLWYHDHSMGVTRLNVYAGLAGMYLLRDEYDTGQGTNPLGLPAGEYEIPLVIQDKIFAKDGTLQFRLATYVAEGRWEGGQAGDVPVVNGVAYPYHEVARGLYRLRLLNGSNLRAMMLSFSNDMPFWVVGTDAGLVDAPIETRRIRLSAGERADIVVDFGALPAGTRVQLRNTDRLTAQFQIAVGDARIRDIVQFRVGAARGWTKPVPQRLRGGAGQPPALPPNGAVERVRTMTVMELPDGRRWPPAVMSLNNLGFDTDDVEMIPVQDDRPVYERWDILNLTIDDHPIHLHIALLRVLERQKMDVLRYIGANPRPGYGRRWAPPAERFKRGAPAAPQPWEAGWKDTVYAPPGVITRILVRWPSRAEMGFDPDAPFSVPSTVAGGAASNGFQPTEVCRLSATTQPEVDQARGYVWHCHVLDHEDHDMMLPVRLV